MSGCIGNSDPSAVSSPHEPVSSTPGDVGNITTCDITCPDSYALYPYNIEGNAICLTDEMDYEGVPIIAPLLKTRGTMISIVWKDDADGFKKNKLDYTELDFEDVSEFSSCVAITFYETTLESSNITNKKAIVVDSYENALLAGPLAAILDVPILFYGETTNEALWRLGARHASDIIAVGNLPYAEWTDVSLQIPQDVHEYTIDAAKSNGIVLDYLVVTNADDNDGLRSYFPQNPNTPYTPHLSSFASLFAIYRNGLVISVANGSKAPSPYTIDMGIEAVAGKLKQEGMKPRFLMMLGDSVSLPFSYYFGNTAIAPVAFEEKIATDNVYASLKGVPGQGYDADSTNGSYNYPKNAIAVDLAHGRIIAKNLSGLSMHFDRIVNYNEYLATNSAPSTPQLNANKNEWNNNAFGYNGFNAEWGWPEEIQTMMNLWMNGEFNIEEGSIKAKSIWPLSLNDDFAKYPAISNFVVSGADHGSPQGNTIHHTDIMPVPPQRKCPIILLYRTDR